MNDREIKNLANAVQHWLSYWDTVSRVNILQESSLRYSISEVIERKYNGLCVLELPHPFFRNRNIDITWSDAIKDDAFFEVFTQRGLERKTNNQLTEVIDKLYQNSDVIECKVVSNHSKYKGEIQRIFNDLCRLYFFKLEYSNRRAFFLLSGGSKLFNGIKTGELYTGSPQNLSNVESSQELAMSYLKGNELTNIRSERRLHIDNIELQKESEKPQQQVTTPSVYANWFSFDLKQPTRTLDLKKSECNGNSLNIEDSADRTNYDLFLNDYEFKPEKFKDDQYKHITFKTVLIALNEAPTDVETEHGVAIWEIIPLN